mgnify:FL=1
MEMAVVAMVILEEMTMVVMMIFGQVVEMAAQMILTTVAAEAMVTPQ